MDATRQGFFVPALSVLQNMWYSHARMGEHESFGGKFYFVPIASLDDVDPAELAAAPIKYSDGRNDRFGQLPKEISGPGSPPAAD
jgi:hypothetical protein